MTTLPYFHYPLGDSDFNPCQNFHGPKVPHRFLRVLKKASPPEIQNANLPSVPFFIRKSSIVR